MRVVSVTEAEEVNQTPSTNVNSPEQLAICDQIVSEPNSKQIC